MARKTTSSEMLLMLLLSADTAKASLVDKRRNGSPSDDVLNETNQILPLDQSLVLRDHVIKRSRSPRSFSLPAIPRRREERA
jgi:hypothetical protein